MSRRFWTAKEDARLAELYPDRPTAKVAAKLKRSLCGTYNRAQLLGIAKSAAYLASPDACRLRRGDNVGAACRYPKGHIPANKGLRRPGWAPGRMAATQFKKGERTGWAHDLYKPIGTERMSKDGYLERKIHDGLPPQSRWRSVHLVVWEAVNAPLPRGHAIVFKNGDRSDIRIENLECITRAELMRRNSVHNLPAPLPQMVQLIGALNRKINRRTKHDEEQNRGSEESPVRSAGGARGHGEADGDRTRESDSRCGARDSGLGESGSRVSERDGASGRNGIHRTTGRDTEQAEARGGERRTLVAGAAIQGAEYIDFAQNTGLEIVT